MLLRLSLLGVTRAWKAHGKHAELRLLSAAAKPCSGGEMRILSKR